MDLPSINHINAFGCEDLHYITNKDIDNIIDSVTSWDYACSTPPKLVKLIHFHPNFPQNHNLKLENDLAFIYNGKQWEKRKKDEPIAEVVRKALSSIINYYNKREELQHEKKELISKEEELYKLYPNIRDDIVKKFKFISDIPVKLNVSWDKLDEVDTKVESIFSYYKLNLEDYFDLKNREYIISENNSEECEMIKEDLERYRLRERDVISKNKYGVKI